MKKKVILLGAVLLFLSGCSSISKKGLVTESDNNFHLGGQVDSNFATYKIDGTRLSHNYSFEVVNDGIIKDIKIVFMEEIPDVKNINFDNALPQCWVAKNQEKVVFIGIKGKDIKFEYYY